MLEWERFFAAEAAPEAAVARKPPPQRQPAVIRPAALQNLAGKFGGRVTTKAQREAMGTA